ncbi:hypothetical protein ACFLSJ_04830 [Verrucomicrobiota bacterium]
MNPLRVFAALLVALGFASQRELQAQEGDKPPEHEAEVLLELGSEPLPPLEDGTNKPPQPTRTDEQPLPDEGETDDFSFSRSTEYEGVFEVSPSDTDLFLPVSESFLNMVLNDERLEEEDRLIVLASYPDMVEQSFERQLARNYPDATVSYPDFFERRVIGSEDGVHAVLEQDELAGPYVRVTLFDEDGTSREFSMNRASVEALLENPYLSPDRIVAALDEFVFHLPEEARSRFDELSQDEIIAMAQNLPSLERQEFVKMHKVLGEIDARTAAGESEEATAPEPVKRPAAPEERKQIVESLMKERKTASRQRPPSFRPKAPESVGPLAGGAGIPGPAAEEPIGFPVTFRLIAALVVAVAGVGGIGYGVFRYLRRS